MFPLAEPAPVGPNDIATVFLVVAHPGHELRVHGWLELARPRVWVITDGSGRTERSRVDSTTRVLAAAGATAGPVYGHMSDTEFYSAVLNLQHERFIRIVDMLAEEVVRDEITYVVADAAEGYNPAHDICRLIVDAAMKIANSPGKRTIENYDFSLVGSTSGPPYSDGLYLNLDDEAYDRKVTAAGNYPELRPEVEAVLNGAGSVGLQQHPHLAMRAGLSDGMGQGSNLRVERLRRVNSNLQTANAAKPFYEEYGELQVAAGHYQHVLRYHEHVLPLALTLARHAERLC